MKRIEIQAYLEIGTMIQYVISVAAENKELKGQPLGDEMQKFFQEQVTAIKAHLAEVDMAHSSGVSDSCTEALDDKELTWKELSRVLRVLLNAAKNELKNTFVGYLPQSRARFWNLEKAFGDKVYDCFPSARDDIVAAGNCYAIEQYDACVFHLMRVVEKGLRALARERGINSIGKKRILIEWAEWGTIIQALEQAANKINNWGRGPKKDRALEFYRGAIGEMSAFKDEYRNYVSHDRFDYDPHQAVGAYHRVCGFMQRLAVHLDETNPRPIRWNSKAQGR